MREYYRRHPPFFSKFHTKTKLNKFNNCRSLHQSCRHKASFSQRRLRQEAIWCKPDSYYCPQDQSPPHLHHTSVKTQIPALKSLHKSDDAFSNVITRVAVKTTSSRVTLRHTPEVILENARSSAAGKVAEDVSRDLTNFHVISAHTPVRRSLLAPLVTDALWDLIICRSTLSDTTKTRQRERTASMLQTYRCRNNLTHRAPSFPTWSNHPINRCCKRRFVESHTIYLISSLSSKSRHNGIWSHCFSSHFIQFIDDREITMKSDGSCVRRTPLTVEETDKLSARKERKTVFIYATLSHESTNKET